MNLSDSMGTAMKQMGFEGDVRLWVGKTISKIEQHRMEYGSTIGECFLVEFSDGTRGWCAGRANSSCLVVGPSRDKLATSSIITADEYGAIMAAEKRRRDVYEAGILLRKHAELDRLKRELGES